MICVKKAIKKMVLPLALVGVFVLSACTGGAMNESVRRMLVHRGVCMAKHKACLTKVMFC